MAPPTSTGAPLHNEHKARLTQLLPDRFYELYGLTEGFGTILDKKDYTRKGNLVGMPPPFFSMRIVDDLGNDLPQGEVGEIIGRVPLQMTAFYNRPDLTADGLVDIYALDARLRR